MSDVNTVFNATKDAMNKAISRLEDELTKIRAGKANPTMLESVSVDYYGTMTPINQVANITATDAKTLTIQPWEKHMLQAIGTAILNSNLGFNPQNNGEILIISLPPLTEERRKEFVKKAKGEGETAKVAIRNARKDGNELIKKLQKDGLSEDEAKAAEGKIQKLTDEWVAKVDTLTDAKEQDIMKV
ncbi:MAG TPA: ribosome recycling factor [Luteibaculaceae bacterium]|nr:ribosome recycling factor [Luteibaculaceae bacterium]